MERIRVLIVDDQDIIREGLQVILELQPDIAVVGQAADGQAGVRLAHEFAPDVVLMDLKMPVLDGIAATRAITQQLPAVNVIILTTYDTDDWVFEGIRAGAQGYLLKDAGSEALVDAIRGVMRGESQLDPAIARKVMNEFRRVSAPLPIKRAPAEDEPAYEALTERENAVLALVAQGMNNRDIAGALFLSEGTVRNYISTIMGKLHANDRTQALVKAAKRGIIKL